MTAYGVAVIGVVTLAAVLGMKDSPGLAAFIIGVAGILWIVTGAFSLASRVLNAMEDE